MYVYYKIENLNLFFKWPNNRCVGQSNRFWAIIFVAKSWQRTLRLLSSSSSSRSFFLSAASSFAFSFSA